MKTFSETPDIRRRDVEVTCAPKAEFNKNTLTEELQTKTANSAHEGANMAQDNDSDRLHQQSTLPS